MRRRRLRASATWLYRFMSADRLTEELKKAEMYSLFTDIEMPLIYSLFHMEQVGIKAERERLKEYGDRLKVQIVALEQKIYEETGETFNINSPKQLGEVLFDHMKLPNGKKTKSGYSTAADVLDKLAPDYPVVQMILDYRQLTKLNSTYAEGLAVYIGTDERIHGTFNQTITATEESAVRSRTFRTSRFVWSWDVKFGRYSCRRMAVSSSTRLFPDRASCPGAYVRR